MVVDPVHLSHEKEDVLGICGSSMLVMMFSISLGAESEFSLLASIITKLFLTTLIDCLLKPQELNLSLMSEYLQRSS